ncbi:unnamed protein product [Closterium sp. NIES-64]|nr:unnamed protein product [Closterium sp. NIES-64]
MATPSVLTYDTEGRAIDFKVWVDDLQLFLQCDRADGLSLFDLTSGVSPAPPATADSTVRSQWATRDAAARLAVRRHLPTTERAHFSQYKSAKTLYDALVERYSSLATAALRRLMLPYLFPDLAAFPTVADLNTHLRTSDTRYRAALPAEGVLPPSSCPLLLLLLRPSSLASSRSALRLPLAQSAAPARARGARELEGPLGAVEVVVEAVEEVGVVVGVVAGVEVSVAAVEAEEVAVVAEGAEVAEVAEAAKVAEAAEAAVELVAALRRGVAPVVVRASSSSAVVRPCPLNSFVSGTLGVSGGELSRAGVAIFDLDFDAILAAMYAVSSSDEGDCYLCVPPDLGIEAAALGAGDAAALGSSASVAPGAGESALSDRTTLTPLSRPVAVSLADPSGGPDIASFSTVLSCPAAPSGTLSGLYLPLFSTNLRAAPHSSEFPPTEAPLQTLHMDVWGPARVRGQGHERYFLLVVDDYSRYTTVFPLRNKGDVTEVLIDSIRAARLQLRESFGSDFPVLRLHSDRGGEFSSAHLGAFCRAQGIRQTFTLPASPQQNGIAESHIGMVIDVARTSMIHATTPHFLWPFAVQYAAHQLNLQPRVSLPETSPTLRWMGKVGNASAFQVWGSRAFVRDLSADKLSPRAVPCVFLGSPPDAPGWQFHHPTSRRVLSSQDVTFDKSVPYYRLFPYRTAPLPSPPLFLAPGPSPVDPLPPQGPAPSGVSQVDAVEPVEVAVDSSAARGAEPAGARPGGAEPAGAESRGAEPWGAESGGAESGGAESGGAEPGGAEPGVAEPGGSEPGGAGSARVASGGASSRRELLSLQELREWFARRWSRATGTGGTTVAAGPRGARPGGSGAAGTGSPAGGTTRAACGTGADGPAGVGAAGAAGAGAAGGVGAGGSAGAGASEGASVGAVRAGCAAGAGAATGGTGAVPASSGGAERPRPYFVPLVEQVLGLAELREPSSRPALPVRAARTSGRAPRPRPPAVPGTHQMAPRPSSAPLRVPLPSPPESSLPTLADPESESLRVASPTIARLLATVVTDPSFESTAASALVAELFDFAARCRLDYAASLVAESESVCPPSVGGECALSTDVLEDRQEEFQCFAAALPHLVSTLIAPEGDTDAPDIPTPRSYAEAIEGPYSTQ